jgi:hypothetical protein
MGTYNSELRKKQTQCSMSVDSFLTEMERKSAQAELKPKPIYTPGLPSFSPATITLRKIECLEQPLPRRLHLRQMPGSRTLL